MSSSKGSKGKKARSAVDGMLGALTSDDFEFSSDSPDPRDEEIRDLKERIRDLEINGTSGDDSELMELKSVLHEYESALDMAIIQSGDREFTFRNFTLTRRGIDIPDDFSRGDWEALGEALGASGDAWQFWVGDYANMNKDDWGRSYNETATLFGLEVETITDFAYVCRQIKFSLRNENLRFSHHKLAAGLVKRFGESVAANALNVAVSQEMSTKAFSTYLAQLRQELLGKKEAPKLTTNEHLNKAYKRVLKITKSLIDNGAEKHEIVRILQKQIDELENED